MKETKIRYKIVGIREEPGHIRLIIKRDDLMKIKQGFDPMSVMRGNFDGVMQKMQPMIPDSICLTIEEYEKGRSEYGLGSLLDVKVTT